MNNGDPVDFDDVLAAEGVLSDVVLRTPVLTREALDRRTGRRVFLKAENRQRTGSFKFRGAYVAARGRGVTDMLTTVSSGNHGRALALAGRLLGPHVIVHMPEDAPRSKVASVQALGASVVTFDRYAVPQTLVAQQLMRGGGPSYISSHDDAQVVAGAATAAVELLQDVPELDALLVPVGGGGALAGAALAAESLQPRCRVYGAEPSASAVNNLSLSAGRRLTVQVPRTIADGQTLTTPGAIPFAVMRHRVAGVLLVSEQEIRDAVAFLRKVCGEQVEPSGATGVAALLSHPHLGAVRVGVLLTGGNGGVATHTSDIDLAPDEQRQDHTRCTDR